MTKLKSSALAAAKLASEERATLQSELNLYKQRGQATEKARLELEVFTSQLAKFIALHVGALLMLSVFAVQHAAV